MSMVIPLRTLAGEAVSSAILVFGVTASALVLAPLDANPVSSALLRTVAVGLLVGTVLWTFGPLGAQAHPLLTLSNAVAGGIEARDGLARFAAQALGAFLGAIAVRLVPLVFVAPDPMGRSVLSVAAREFIVAFGFILGAWGTAGQSRGADFALVLGILAGLAYWMTGSTSAAHPLVLLSGSLSDPAWSVVIVGLLAQVLGAIVATGIARWLFRTSPSTVLTCCRDAEGTRLFP